MRDTFKLVSWAILLVGWGIFVIGALIEGKEPIAISYGIAAVISMACWAVALSWLFGLRRRVAGFLELPLSDAVLQEKNISATRLADLRRTLEKMCEEQRSSVSTRTMPSRSTAYSGTTSRRSPYNGLASSCNRATTKTIPPMRSTS
ncbi:MAG: hypothetical protein CMJ78_19250 [Planctomycetaceae bacterium]|nr:hypothetical protein [Planctomycetaceae bacterium]